MSHKFSQRALVPLERVADGPQAATSGSRPVRGEATALPSVAPDLSGKTVYVVDAHSLIFQVFHALPEMTSPVGEPVNAVFGFARDMLYLLEEKQPDYLVCAFDSPGLTFRHELFSEYKIQREPMPEELRPQIPAIRRLLEAMGIPVLECPSYEADDIVATVARRTESLGGQCYIVSGDKDCRQLLSESVKIYNLRKDELFDRESLEQHWGIRPEQVVDFQAMVGDPVDNVPGIPLIGPKIASQLLGQFGTLEAVFEHAHEVAGTKRRQNLLEGRRQALASRTLVRLDDQVPVELDWKAARVGALDRGRVGELFREFGFRSLAEKFSDPQTGKAAPPWKADYQTVQSIDQLARLVDEMLRQSCISVDTETTHINPRRAELVGISLAWREGEAYYIPLRAPEGDVCLDSEAVLTMLRPVLEDARVEKVGQNLKYDMVVLRGAGVQLQGVTFDTMVASYLLDAGQRNHNLDELARRYLGHTTIKIGQLIGTGKSQKRMDEVLVQRVTEYACEDADVALRLVPILRSRLGEEQLGELFSELEVPLIEVLAEMEFHGIRVDVARLAELSSQYSERMDALEQEIYRLGGGPFNIASPRQMAQVLFGRLKLPVLKRTKTGPSTDADVLEELAALDELPAKLIEYRQYAKLKGTYVDALPALVHRQTGRIHTSFNQVVAATGRLSSADPNLQNIPVRTSTSREIRSAFLPREDDWRLVAADYSQIELRVLAHFSGDAALLAAFAEDQDIHARVASEVYRVPLAQVTGPMRRHAKAINFGIIYGQSPFGLAKGLGIEKQEAAAFIDAYFNQYPGVHEFFETILAQCRQNGYVTTILGRRRKVQGVRDSSHRGDSRQRNLPERTAINTVIQGSAADLIKQAMINVYRRLRREACQARMLLQIHDELVFETPQSQVNALSELAVAEMTGVGPLSVPLKVDVKSGTNWAECESSA
jgi:DNA polymerase-1